MPDARSLLARMDKSSTLALSTEAFISAKFPTVFRHRLMERKCKIEGLFGQAKQNHGMRRMRCRGHAKAQIQLLLAAIALNYKRKSPAIRPPALHDWLFNSP